MPCMPPLYGSFKATMRSYNANRAKKKKEKMVDWFLRWCQEFYSTLAKKEGLLFSVWKFSVVELEEFKEEIKFEEMYAI